ncbi:MAG: ribose-phosphate diphosphokinase [bacterium]|nr:ribose-phosphate pyrophosphokinase [Myxococcales bacterium]MCB9543842.1 ribose-phosphate pyrophosphokinase [Myxococcales bacterium]MCB9553291.1 ribose-phosphate pyrophosphokinase [Myxococcales bacterium]
MPCPVVFANPGYEALAAALCQQLGCEGGEVERRTFPDGERYQRIVSEVEGREVVVVGGTVDDAATLSLYDLASAAVMYGARRLSLVVPYFGYATMERAVAPGEVVVAKTRARLLSHIPRAAAGNRVLLLDLHSEGIPHYFEGGTAAFHVYAKSVLAPVMAEAGGDGFVLGSTDSGRAKWVESLANDLGVDAAVILKRRLSGSETRVTAVSASVEGRSVVIYDDMIRTGGSLIGAARAYLDAGARRLVAVATHGVLPGDSLARLRATGLFEQIVVTDSHPRAVALAGDGLRVVPIAGCFVEHLAR